MRTLCRTRVAANLLKAQRDHIYLERRDTGHGAVLFVDTESTQILLLEDNPVNLKVLAKTVEKNGFVR